MLDHLRLAVPYAPREVTLLVLLALSAGLFVVTVAFSVYALALRLRNDRRDRRRRELAAR